MSLDKRHKGPFFTLQVNLDHKVLYSFWKTFMDDFYNSFPELNREVMFEITADMRSFLDEKSEPVVKLLGLEVIK